MIEQRNMAGSDIIVSRPSQAVWSDWTVSKAVAEGYKATSWVYRAVSIIATNASSVPWVVFGKDNQAIWEHPISKLMDKPNPYFTRQQLFELIVDWLALAGNGYLKIVAGSRGDPQELWPVSPDRIAPRPSADPAKFIDGYEVLDSKGVRRLSGEYTPENTAHFKLMNPANPYAGISPLMAAARAADLDNAQQEWNVSVMQNRAVPEGLFTFKRDLDETLFSAIVRRLKERMSGTAKARDPMVVGSEATYTRLGLSPVELDYLESRKFSRDEMYIVYGIPPQLGGAMEASTYNNFAASMRIFWETTLIPTYLDKIKDGLNAALSKHLQPGQYICYDLSTIAAMRDNDAEKAGTAKLYVDMGVPFAQINEKYELGFEPWEGWDRPTPKQSAPAADPTAKRWKLRTLEQRGIDAEIKARDDYAEGPLTKAVAALLEEDRMAVFAALESGAEPAEAAKLNRKAWARVLQTAYMDVATDAAARLLDTQRSTRGGHETRAGIDVPPEVTQAVDDVLQQESTILRELSLIEASTVRTIIEQVVFATQADPSNVLPVTAIQQALTDTGVFSPVRALRIARTVSGAAMGIGQMTAGQMAGATHKSWHIAGAHTRDYHARRSGERIEMNKRFSAQVGKVGPRFPCDPDVEAADRINCFLPGTEIRGNVLGAQRAIYDGEAVEIVTRGGRVVRVTNNHPVLSKDGFIFARKVNVGDKLLCCVIDNNGPCAAMVSNENDKPPEVEQVFSAVAQSVFVELPRRCASDFYGDGDAINGNVDVVWTDSKLLNARNAAICEDASDFAFMAKDLELLPLDGDSSGQPGFVAINPSSRSTPSSAALPFYTAFRGLDGLPFKGLRFGLSAKTNSAFDQLQINGATSNSDPLGNGIDRIASQVISANPCGNLRGDSATTFREPEFRSLLSGEHVDSACLDSEMYGGGGDAEAVSDFLHRGEGLIELDEVVSVRVFWHSGYVYDVMTSNGIVAGNDILTSNCRCAMTFDAKDT